MRLVEDGSAGARESGELRKQAIAHAGTIRGQGLQWAMQEGVVRASGPPLAFELVRRSQPGLRKDRDQQRQERRGAANDSSRARH
jgi:hypothetical protein